MSTNHSPVPALLPEWLALVQEKVETLSYGVVQIVVHDRRVTQIERTEKTRLEPVDADPTPRRQRY